MLSIPENNSLPINLLASCFNNTSATYKFYWFISLIEEIEHNNYEISKQSLFARMIANAWYTVNYFKLSFGKQDQLQKAIEQLIEIEHLNIDTKKQQILDTLTNSKNLSTNFLLKHFDAEVPYRFLSPWFSSMKGNKKEIYTFSQFFFNNTLYGVNERDVIINPIWIPYFRQNIGILKAFCYWKLSLYLQKHNPNVPDIPNKLIKAPARNNLSKQRKNFWDLVVRQNGPLTCIYTGCSLDIGDYAVEHFLPYAFVSHDLLWNLIPADKRFNCSKSDKLPSMKYHFEPYCSLQVHGIKSVLSNAVNKNTKELLQDYLTFIPDFNNFLNLDEQTLKQRFYDNINPLITIAANNGFEFMQY